MRAKDERAGGYVVVRAADRATKFEKVALLSLHRWQAADGRGEQASEMPLRGQRMTRQELAAAMSLPGQRRKQQERAVDDGTRQEQERAVVDDGRWQKKRYGGEEAKWHSAK